jgi:hypothetical protein
VKKISNEESLTEKDWQNIISMSFSTIQWMIENSEVNVKLASSEEPTQKKSKSNKKLKGKKG